MTGRAGGNGPGPRDALPPGPRPSPLAQPSAPPPDAPSPPPTTAATGGGECGPLRRVIRIVNPLGLHQRVADRFSRTAGQFVCTVTVWNGEVRADGKNIWDLIMLVVLPDTEVILEVDGPDAPKALEPLAGILASPGGEDYTI